jgi:hypothetical protein
MMTEKLKEKQKHITKVYKPALMGAAAFEVGVAAAHLPENLREVPEVKALIDALETVQKIIPPEAYFPRNSGTAIALAARRMKEALKAFQTKETNL